MPDGMVKFETVDREDGTAEVAVVSADGERLVIREGSRGEIAAFRDGFSAALMMFTGMLALMTPESGWRP